MSPWTYEYAESDSSVAWFKLKAAVAASGLKIVQSTDQYILAAEKGASKQPAGSSLFYEFLIRPEDKLVLQRALVDKTVFIYPLQQPVSDFGVLTSKLDQIKESLGWLRVGE